MEIYNELPKDLKIYIIDKYLLPYENYYKVIEEFNMLSSYYDNNYKKNLIYIKLYNYQKKLICQSCKKYGDFRIRLYLNPIYGFICKKCYSQHDKIIYEYELYLNIYK